MWIRVALSKEAIHDIDPVSCSSVVKSKNGEAYYFDQIVADALEADGFLTAMWDKLDALFDWGDCDFFPPDKCVIFREWLISRLSHETSPVLQPVYEVMLDYANKAIAHQTGISFDF